MDIHRGSPLVTRPQVRARTNKHVESDVGLRSVNHVINYRGTTVLGVMTVRRCRNEFALIAEAAACAERLPGCVPMAAGGLLHVRNHGGIKVVARN